MLDTTLGALLPMVVTFFLGFVAAWRRDFGPKDASILNRMVLLYAVPLMLFAGTVVSVTILLLTLDTAGEDSQGTSPAKDGEHSASPSASHGTRATAEEAVRAFRKGGWATPA